MTRLRIAAGLLAAGLLSAGLVVTGCASGEEAAAPAASPTTSGPATSPEAPSSSSAPPSPSPRVMGKEIKVRVKDGEVSPPTRRVQIAEGTRVRLLVTSDVADALHVHGFEIERRLPAGRQVTVAFVADQTGLFEVETHETKVQLVQLEVR